MENILDVLRQILSMDPYKERKVCRSVINDAMIDTCAVSDSKKPFETAIMHPDYNNGYLIVVELYDTREEAKIGHDKWIELISKMLPSQLVDVNETSLQNLAEKHGETCRGAYERKIHKEI